MMVFWGSSVKSFLWFIFFFFTCVIPNINTILVIDNQDAQNKHFLGNMLVELHFCLRFSINLSSKNYQTITQWHFMRHHTDTLISNTIPNSNFSLCQYKVQYKLSINMLLLRLYLYYTLLTWVDTKGTKVWQKSTQAKQKNKGAKGFWHYAEGDLTEKCCHSGLSANQGEPPCALFGLEWVSSWLISPVWVT